jgi:gas vesicle protein
MSANNDSMRFFKGMGLGIMVGSAVGMAFAPQKKHKNVVGKALKAAGELADNISDAMMR